MLFPPILRHNLACSHHSQITSVVPLYAYNFLRAKILIEVPRSIFVINLEGKQDVMDAKWPEDLFKRQVQFHAQAMKKVPSQ